MRLTKIGGLFIQQIFIDRSSPLQDAKDRVTKKQQKKIPYLQGIYIFSWKATQ